MQPPCHRGRYRYKTRGSNAPLGSKEHAAARDDRLHAILASWMRAVRLVQVARVLTCHRMQPSATTCNHHAGGARPRSLSPYGNSHPILAFYGNRTPRLPLMAGGARPHDLPRRAGDLRVDDACRGVAGAAALGAARQLGRRGSRGHAGAGEDAGRGSLGGISISEVDGRSGRGDADGMGGLADMRMRRAQPSPSRTAHALTLLHLLLGGPRGRAG